jgi:hypothetical protein
LLAFYEPIVHAAFEAGAVESENETLRFQLPTLPVTIALSMELVRSVRFASEMDESERTRERLLSKTDELLAEKHYADRDPSMVEVIVDREE